MKQFVEPMRTVANNDSNRRVFIVAGDSMSPKYPSGARAILERANEDVFIAWGEAYVLDTIDGEFLKRVYPTDDPAVIECRSENPAYPPFQVKKEWIYSWWRVRMAFVLG